MTTKLQSIGNINDKKVFYLSVFENKNWSQLLPNNNWCVLIISNNNSKVVIQTVANDCIKNKALYMCAFGTDNIESIYDNQDVYYFEKQLITEIDYINTTSHRMLEDAFYHATSISFHLEQTIEKVVILNLDKFCYLDLLKAYSNKINKGFKWNYDKNKWTKGLSQLKDIHIRKALKKLSAIGGKTPRDAKRIDAVLSLIRVKWQLDPDLRLGQLLIDLVKPSKPCPELFFIEDDKLLELLK